MGGLTRNGVGFRSIEDVPRIIFRKFSEIFENPNFGPNPYFLKNDEIHRDRESRKMFFVKITFVPNFSLSVAKPK